jgi:cell division GTPase FtsZ
LARLNVDVIVTHGTPGVSAAKQGTSTIPIVIVVGDAVGSGFVSSLAQPGGNVTGLTFFQPELAAKRLELLKEAITDLKDVGILLNSTNPMNDTVLPKITQVAQFLKLELHQFDVRRPFEFEGTRRRKAADEGIRDLKESVDALITIPNERLLQMVDPKTPITEAFRLADDVLRQGIGGISDLITKPGIINLDFADVRSIMEGAGSALMAIGYGSGETRCIDAAKHAISSPLLETSIEGATGVLYNITGSSNLTLTETSDAAEIIRAAVDEDAEIIYGTSIDDSMGDAVMITLIATGFADRQPALDFPPQRRQGRQPQQRGDRVPYRVAQPEGGSRPAHQSPILPDEDFDEESSIIRFLRER